MATYGSARTYAQMLGFDDQAQALQQTLNEEGETDHMLTRLAESTINPQAEQAPMGMEHSMRGTEMGRGAERGTMSRGTTGQRNMGPVVRREEETTREDFEEEM
jgi:hypothetical protein